MPSVFDFGISEYLSELGSKSPAPGGGCAAALTAAQGVALFAMVADLTSGSELADSIKVDCQNYISKFETLGDLDVIAFKSVMAAMKLPKNTEEEKLARKTALDASLKEAASVPMKVLELCQKTVSAASQLIKVGNKNVLSDIGVGLYLLDAAAKSSKLNVLINLKYLKDTEFVNQSMKNVTEITDKFIKASQELSSSVEQAITPVN